MKKTNLVLAVLAALLFVSCCEKKDEQLNINAQKLIGTWRYSEIVDLDSIIAEARLINLPISLGKATFNYEWTFNKDKKTGFVNAFLDYKGKEINAVSHPKSFKYTAKETYITFSEFPYEIIEENSYLIDFNMPGLPMFAIFAAVLNEFGVDVFTPYEIEENKLTLTMFGYAEYIKLQK